MTDLQDRLARSNALFRTVVFPALQAELGWTDLEDSEMSPCVSCRRNDVECRIDGYARTAGGRRSPISWRVLTGPAPRPELTFSEDELAKLVGERGPQAPEWHVHAYVWRGRLAYYAAVRDAHLAAALSSRVPILPDVNRRGKAFVWVEARRLRAAGCEMLEGPSPLALGA